MQHSVGVHSRSYGHFLRLRSGLAGLIALGAFGFSGIAGAQTTPTDPATAKPAVKPETKPETKSESKPAASDPTTVTVTAQKPLNQADKQVYDNTKDADSQTGTVADALNKVPGVNVDASGNVTLRGKSPQILINGKPSALMSGDNRAAALQAMPSGMVSSIEVMNNPGAQYGSDSSGSIINLVTKKALPPGGIASVNVQATSTGGHALNTFGQYHAGKISVTGFASLRKDKRPTTSGSLLQQFDSSGRVTRTTQQNSTSDSNTSSAVAGGNFEYNLSDADTLTVPLMYFRNETDGPSLTNSVTYGANGAATDIYTRTGSLAGRIESQSTGLTWSHVGKKPGETLKVDAKISRNLSNFLSTSLNDYSLSSVSGNLGTKRSISRANSDATNTVFSIDYNTPIGVDQLTAGVQITTDKNDSGSQFFGPDALSVTTPTTNPLLTSEFIYEQTISAAYITYQKPFGTHWTVLGGLRSETFDLDTQRLPSNTTSRVNYTTVNPSFYTTYVISDRDRLRFSYSRRLQRPSAQDYNPGTVYNNEQSVSVGQANLKPQTTQNFELGYEYAFQGKSYQLRGYHTREERMIISVSTFITDPLGTGNQVVQTSRQNAGSRDTTGIEANYNGKLTPKLAINLSANLSTVDFHTPNAVGTQSVTGLGGNLSLTYTAANKDSFNVRYNASPKLLSGQGYRSAYGTTSLQYSHPITPKARLLIVINDAFRSAKTETVTSGPAIYSSRTSSPLGPTAYIGLNMSFGNGGFTAPKGMTVTRPGGGNSPPGGGGVVITTGPGGG